MFLVLGGLAIALIPGAPEIELEPDIVFLVFLPPLLYAAAFTASPRDLKAQAGRIGLLAIVLVGLTVVAVAVVARLVFDDCRGRWPSCSGRCSRPPTPWRRRASSAACPSPRVGVVVEGEALVNDGVALTLYRVAVGAATAGTFALGSAALELVLVAVGGAATGLAVGWVLLLVRRRVQETEIEIALSLLTP